MPLEDARRVIRQAIEDDGTLTAEDLPRALRAKREMLDEQGILDLQFDCESFAGVGGLAKLKRWLDLRRRAFVDSAAAAQLPAPKGVLLLGVQGSGKSLAAKAVAGTWRVPLLRLDFGALYNKYLGETERNLREVLKGADAMAPCVLWIDEIEKGLATDEDQGASRRVLGTLLTWMNERKSRVFMVATANDVSALPPELLRKGRFDELFFVDLPDESTRAEILRIHLQRRQLELSEFDLAALAKASEEFSGAELEQAIVAALYEAHAAQERLSTQRLLDELKLTKPLSVLRAEEIEALRDWAKERAVPAG
jgi:SpoVK/Ycf46/Vps4 family AAA+-type ATPase